MVGVQYMTCIVRPKVDELQTYDSSFDIGSNFLLVIKCYQFHQLNHGSFPEVAKRVYDMMPPVTTVTRKRKNCNCHKHKQITSVDRMKTSFFYLHMDMSNHRYLRHCPSGDKLMQINKLNHMSWTLVYIRSKNVIFYVYGPYHFFSSIRAGNNNLDNLRIFQTNFPNMFVCSLFSFALNTLGISWVIDFKPGVRIVYVSV